MNAPATTAPEVLTPNLPGRKVAPAKSKDTGMRRAWPGQKDAQTYAYTIEYEGETFHFAELPQDDCREFSKALRRVARSLSDVDKRQKAITKEMAGADDTAPFDEQLEALDTETQELLNAQEKAHEEVLRKTLRGWSLETAFTPELISEFSRADKMALGQGIVSRSVLGEGADFLGKPTPR